MSVDPKQPSKQEDDTAVELTEVRRDELAYILQRRRLLAGSHETHTDDPTEKDLEEAGRTLVGLALSGGGIVF
jgi:hypothetical protein